MPETTFRTEVIAAAPSPCRACPWRTENHGKPHPDGWYKPSNLTRLWKGLKTGETMTCHPTDPSNPVSDEAEASGSKPAPAHAVTRECTGALILQQREVMVFTEIAESGDEKALKTYAKRRPGGMTREGMFATAMRAGVTWPGEVPMSKPDLNQAVSHPGGRLEWKERHDG